MKPETRSQLALVIYVAKLGFYRRKDRVMNSFKKSLTIIITGIILSGLTGCNGNTEKIVSTNPQVVGSTVENDDNVNLKQEQSNKALENTYNGEWHSISRLRYIKGTIVSLKQSSEGKYILNLKVEFNYHSETDPVRGDFPFKIGEVVEFTLKDKPKIALSNNKRIIIYQGQITTDGKNDFLGADIKYYEEKGKYFDMTGKEINLPPHDYPSSW
ncbi:hypothetical protein [Desulfitobacterium sp.]|uniref:hypothetical protein n=1 Tax=Desulfitobacterium sp. TaxID=49981 RepID=UPI002D7FB7CB|nr:hypothetical protein [Desulfitobacterium sp.]